MRRFLIWLPAAMLAAAILVAGCSDDGVSPAPGPTVPQIPEPSFYGDPDVPLKSEELVVATCIPTNFYPIVQAARFPSPSYSLEPDTLYSLVMTGGIANPAGIKRYPLILDDGIEPEPMIGIQVNSGDTYPVEEMRAYPLGDRPTLQYIRYWVRLGVVEYYAGGIETSVERSVTTGMSETRAESFTKTLGMEASMSGSWFVSFSVSVRTEFEWSESTETTYSSEETTTETFTISPEADKNLAYTVWSLVEEFRFIDENGDPFTDWGYGFDPDSIASATHRTATTVPVSTYFDQ